MENRRFQIGCHLQGNRHLLPIIKIGMTFLFVFFTDILNITNSKKRKFSDRKPHVSRKTNYLFISSFIVSVPRNTRLFLHNV